jgi:hypothetical protein
METIKTAAIRKIEQRMEGMEEDSLRCLVLQSAKDFKTSWIKLGQSLYTVWNDKLYKDWGYQAFETYTIKEVGIKKQTAMKLVHSYSFLEKEEPMYLQKDYNESVSPEKVPSYEAVNVLRLAKRNREIDETDYAKLKKDVFQEGRDAGIVKKDLTQLIKQRKEFDPEEETRKNTANIRRCVTTLRSLKRDIEILKILPEKIAVDIDKLIAKIEEEI